MTQSNKMYLELSLLRLQICEQICEECNVLHYNCPALVLKHDLETHINLYHPSFGEETKGAFVY